MIKNIFVTGLPGCGKTSLIMEILKELNLKAGGFYTQEIRKEDKRLGFQIKTLDGREGILAQASIKSPYQVSKYRVNMKDLEEIGVNSILAALKTDWVIIIDEIGPMELYSEKFKKAVKTALDSKNKVLGTIMLKENPFCDKIKQREDTKVFYLKRESFQEIKKEIKKLLR